MKWSRYKRREVTLAVPAREDFVLWTNVLTNIVRNLDLAVQCLHKGLCLLQVFVQWYLTCRMSQDSEGWGITKKYMLTQDEEETLLHFCLSLSPHILDGELLGCFYFTVSFLLNMRHERLKIPELSSKSWHKRLANLLRFGTPVRFVWLMWK